MPGNISSVSLFFTSEIKNSLDSREIWKLYAPVSITEILLTVLPVHDVIGGLSLPSYFPNDNIFEVIPLITTSSLLLKAMLREPDLASQGLNTDGSDNFTPVSAMSVGSVLVSL